MGIRLEKPVKTVEEFELRLEQESEYGNRIALRIYQNGEPVHAGYILSLRQRPDGRLVLHKHGAVNSEFVVRESGSGGMIKDV